MDEEENIYVVQWSWCRIAYTEFVQGKNAATTYATKIRDEKRCYVNIREVKILDSGLLRAGRKIKTIIT